VFILVCDFFSTPYLKRLNMDKNTVGVIVGSLRKDSLNKKVALHLAGLLGDRFYVKFI